MNSPSLLAPELAGRVEAALRVEDPQADVVELRPMTSGASGVTLVARVHSPRGARQVVVKTIPAGLRPTRNRDLARQVRLLRHLARAGSGAIPVPEVVAFDPGDLGSPPLYVMSHVPGETFDPTNPGLSVHASPGTTRARAYAAVRALAALQGVDVEGLGEGPTSLADEIARWERALTTTSGAHRTAADEIVVRLRATVPVAMAPALAHGDYRLGNLLFRDAELVAVLDWEIWSVADPRLDLAWFLARAIAGHPCHPDEALGLPAAGDLLDAYGGEPPAFAWFLALAAVKHAAASALIDKRTPGGRDPGRTGRLLAWAARQLETHERVIGNG